MRLSHAKLTALRARIPPVTVRTAGYEQEAKVFEACKEASATRKERCFDIEVTNHTVELVNWSRVLDLFDLRALDLLVLDPQVDFNQVGFGVASLLKAFPFDRLRPALLYYRHASSRELRQLLLRRGYSTSAHWETSYWGESNIAWRSDRCELAGGGAPWVPFLDAPDVESVLVEAQEAPRAPHIEL